jgi:hypothetical protein
MSAFAWVVVAFLGWLSVVGFVLLLVRGGAAADRLDANRERLDAERQRLLSLGVPPKLLDRIEQARTVRPWVQR